MNETQTVADFESLLAPALERVYRCALSLTGSSDAAEDLVQEATLRAFSAFPEFQRGTHFQAWYLRILTKEFLKRRREKERTMQTADLEETEARYLNRHRQAAGLVADPEDPAGTLLGPIESEHVAGAIAGLSEEFGTVCTLYFVLEASYPEIAEILEISVDTVRSRLHHGRRLLQRALWRAAVDHGVIGGLAARPGNTSATNRLGRLNCEEPLGKFDDFLDREIPPRDAAWVREHLETCRTCAGDYAFEESVLRNVRRKLSRIAPPPGLLRKISARIAEANRPSGPG